ncbi:MAG: hypothetical protein IJM14_10485 [Lachnospiraceae bacterium]|nr:hypothetical protein [Lachnospiraceae bacterium]
MDKELFRQKTVEKMSTPDDLTEYLKVTSTSVWMVLATVLVLLTGLIAWGFLGHLDTKVDAKASIKDGQVTVKIPAIDAEDVKDGMEIEIEGKSTKIRDVVTDEFGRTTGSCSIDLPDGEYDAEITTESLTPVSFLFE